MAGKITDYTPITTLTAGDLMDWSNYDEVSAYTSNSITWANLLVNINAQASFPDTNTNIFSNDGTIGAGRIATLTDSLTFATGQVNLAASAAGYPSFNIGNGSDPSSPSDGDMWFNGTNLYFRDGAVSVDLLAGGSDTNFANTDLTLTGNRVHDLGVNELTFGTTGDAQLMRFDATNSRIGIGTSTPTEKLEVVGNAKITGGIDIDSGIFNINSTGDYWNLGLSSVTEADSRAVTIGRLSTTFNSGGGSLSIAIGNESTAIPGDATSSISLGHKATAIGSSGIIIGSSAGAANTTSQGADIILIGRDTGNGVVAMALENIFIGKAATGTSAQGAVGIGADTNVNGNFSAAVGFRTEADGLSSIALGDRVKATATESYIIGSGGATTATNSVASSLAVAFGANIPFRFSETTDSYLNGSGNVGIGTSTPTAKLEVVGNAKITGNVDAYADTNINGFNLYGVSQQVRGGLRATDNGVNGQLFLQSATDEISFRTGFNCYLDIAGNFAIGTSVPQGKLHVEGPTWLNGNITTNGNDLINGNLTVNVGSAGYDGIYLKGSGSANNNVTLRTRGGGDHGQLALYDPTNAGAVVVMDSQTPSNIALDLDIGKFSNPAYKSGGSSVNVYGDTGASKGFNLFGVSQEVRGGLRVSDNGTNGQLLLQSLTETISFKTGGDSYFDIAGNFGVGTPTPTEKLEVVGSIKTSVGYKVGAATGFTGTGAYTNFTIVGGIITAAS